MKVVTFPNQTAANAVLNRTRNAGNAVARRATTVHPAAAHLVPATWNGSGNPPRGWTVPHATLNEPGSARVAVVVEDDFARGKPDFAGAADGLPADWKRVPDGEVDGAVQQKGKAP